MALNYLNTIRQFTEKCEFCFETQPPVTHRAPTKDELAKLAHQEWMPEQLLAFCNLFNGALYAWQSKPESAGRPCRGKLHLQRLQDVYADWEGTVYFANRLEADGHRLRDFKVLDFFADEAGVGFYHDAAQDRELYLYVFQEYGPLPLGVDFDGYLQLLSHSLAHSHWPYLLAELAEHFATRPAQPFPGPHTPNARIFVDDMSSQTDFSLAEFVALYEQVRLPHQDSAAA